MATKTATTRSTKEETIRFFHKGVKVIVHMDYQNGVISLVDEEGKPQKYCFAQREKEYMNGWRLVLQAMDVAVVEAQRLMELHQKKAEKEKEELIIKSLKEISKEELS